MVHLQPGYWEHSSAGSEHLPYKQGVTGSNPVAPTFVFPFFRGFFSPVGPEIASSDGSNLAFRKAAAL